MVSSSNICFLRFGLLESDFNGGFIGLTMFFAKAGYGQGLFGDKGGERRGSLQDGDGPRQGDGS